MRLKFSMWLPQRRWTLYLFIVVLLWQNPVLIATNMVRNPSQQLRIACSVLQSVGYVDMCVPLPAPPPIGPLSSVPIPFGAVLMMLVVVGCWLCAR
jgi:hypothetical protein